ncbi:Lrp/AsnC family transcriptional regulator [Rarobacter faecitabidus]|uniref:AsnC family transcriptional regulator n=1 Tax=Rarobacter faecitabidus TaxID=13243 RepID=A0A542ZAB2_RARFA|nr:Lrp/AsnC family transcriptional regulator [Rarobacter faecitabidus]TQL57231.1 AsnC family transcriptional regulator [Rarobacter faecitabidus]
MDAIDRRIVELLRDDSRTALGVIGAQVGLSASAVKRRVDRLRELGIIRRFTIVVDETVANASTEAYVEVFCRGTVAPAMLKTMLEQVPEVVYAGTVTGDADAVALLRARDIAALEQALERVRAMPNVDRTRSAVVLTPLVQK